MELQAKLTALEEEVGILKVEIKSILQEVRVAVLAKQNPFLAGEPDRATGAAPAPVAAPSEPSAELVSVSVAPAGTPPISAGLPDSRARIVRLAAAGAAEPDEDSVPDEARPVDLAALMAWLQETAESFSRTELVMLVTIAGYGGLINDGLKQALIELSPQVSREGPAQASVSDFSLALSKLQSIRPATSAQPRRAAA